MFFFLFLINIFTSIVIKIAFLAQTAGRFMFHVVKQNRNCFLLPKNQWYFDNDILCKTSLWLFVL